MIEMVLISAFTVPSGGTSDYGPEMLHAAAQGLSYAAFVREFRRSRTKKT